MSGVRSPKKRLPTPELTPTPPSPKKLHTFVFTIQNGLKYSIHLHNMGAENLQKYTDDLNHMKAGQTPETDFVFYTMTPRTATGQPGWIKSLDDYNPSERAVVLYLLKNYLHDNQIVYRDLTPPLDPSMPAVTVFIGKDEQEGEQHYFYTIIGAPSSNLRNINLGAPPHPRPVWIPGDMANPAKNWSNWYFDADEHIHFHYQQGYHKCTYVMAMKYYLRCLVKGYSFTEDSVFQDTVIGDLPQELQDYHARLTRIHDTALTQTQATPNASAWTNSCLNC